MYLVRDVMHCKPGKVREIVKRFKALNDLAPKVGMPKARLMTDVSGDRFWTVVGEFEVESLDAFFTMMEQVVKNEEAGRIMANYHDLVESGRREFYKLEG